MQTVRPCVDFDGMGLETMPADLEALARLAESVRGKCDRMIEVGSWAGRTARVLLDAAPQATLFCVDTWQGSWNDRTGLWAKKLHEREVLKTFCANQGKDLFHKIIPLVGPSALWAAVWPEDLEHAADLIFIDADHAYAEVRRDIEGWQAKVRPGGILCGHDYGVFPGVGHAVHDVFGDTGKVQTAGQCLWFVEM